MSSFNEIAIQKFLGAEFSRISRVDNSTILDLGCGSRPYFALYNDRFSSCIGGDHNIRGPIDVLLNAAKLPFMSASFDVVLMSEVIEHVREADKALKEIGRVLKPGGLLLITWPFNYMIHELPHDYVRYTEFGMSLLLNNAGLQIEHIFRRGNAILVVFVVVEFLANGLFEFLVRTPFVGRAFGLARDVLRSLTFGVLYRGYLSLTWQQSYQSKGSVGAGLKGPIGHMALWNLGYCARVRKPCGGS